MDFGFVRIYYLEEIAECRANAPGWEIHWGLPTAVNQRRGGEERRRDVRTGINYVLAVCQALGLA